MPLLQTFTFLATLPAFITTVVLAQADRPSYCSDNPNQWPGCPDFLSLTTDPCDDATTSESFYECYCSQKAFSAITTCFSSRNACGSDTEIQGNDYSRNLTMVLWHVTCDTLENSTVTTPVYYPESATSFPSTIDSSTLESGVSSGSSSSTSSDSAGETSASPTATDATMTSTSMSMTAGAGPASTRAQSTPTPTGAAAGRMAPLLELLVAPLVGLNVAAAML